MKLEFNEIGDLEKILKIPTKKLLKEFTSIDLVYLHYSLSPRDWVNDLIEEITPNLTSYETFVKIVPKKIGKNAMKKIPREEIINDLTFQLSKDDCLKMEYVLGISEKGDSAYSVLKSMLVKDYLMSEDIENISLIIEELKSCGSVKSFIQLLIVLGRTKNILNESDFKKILNDNSKYIGTFYISLCTEYFNENKELNKKLDSLESIWLNRVEEKELKNQKLKEVNKKISKELTELKKAEKKKCSDDNVVYKDMDIAEIRKMFNSIMESQKKSFEDVLNMKNTLSVTSYENQIDKLNTTISDLRVSSALKSRELKDALSEVESLKNEIERLNAIINNRVSLDSADKDLRLFESALDLIDKENPMEKPVRDVYIGYVRIENGEHYVIDSKGRKNKLNNIRENVYIPNDQFVLVNANHEFLYSSTSFYDGVFDLNNVQLGLVVESNPIRVEVNGVVDCSLEYNPHIILKKNQLVAIKNNFIVKPFKTQKLTLDNLLEPIKLQGQDVYYVLGYFGNKIAVRDVETGIEDALEFDRSEVGEIKVKDIICVKEDKVVNVINSKYWYTNSSYYKDKIEFGVVSKEGGTVFVNKQNGEKSMVGNIPYRTLEKILDGDVIAVDEYNEYLYTEDTESIYIDKPNYVSSKKSASQMFKNSNKNVFDISNCKGKVAVIGSFEARDSYINYFRKNGYDVQFIYGYEKNLSRVKKEFKDCDAIICDPSHAGHYIQDALKRKGFVPDNILVGFAENHGATGAYSEFARLKGLKI